MTLKSQLLASGAFGGMTANEQRLGRFIRDGEGHPAPAAPPAAPAADDFEVEPAPPAKGPNDFDIKDFTSETVGSDTPPSGEASQSEPPSDEEAGAPEEQDNKPDELVAARAEADRRVAEAQRRADEAIARAEKAEREAESLRKPKGTEEGARDPDAAPNPDDYEFGEADSRYLSDFADWKVDQRFKQREAEQSMKADVERLEQGWQAAISSEDVTAKYPDFAEKVTKGAETEAWKCSVATAILIKDSAVGPDIAYHLASNPEEAARIASLDVPSQVQEISRLEGRFMYVRDNPGGASPTPKLASDAPTPPAARTRGAGGKFDTSERSMYRKMLQEFN